MIDWKGQAEVQVDKNANEYDILKYFTGIFQSNKMKTHPTVSSIFCVGFMDYEKAFDFANRANIVSDLMKKGCGHNMVRAIAKMFTTSTYYPKVGSSNLGEGITTEFGVTQGRCSSGNLFSFYVSDMHSAFINTVTNDFMDPYNLAQLADDTAFFAENINTLRMKFETILSFSNIKYQIPNIKKTQYSHFSKTPSYEPVVLNNNVSIGSVDHKGYKYLGIFSIQARRYLI